MVKYKEMQHGIFLCKGGHSMKKAFWYSVVISLVFFLGFWWWFSGFQPSMALSGIGTIGANDASDCRPQSHTYSYDIDRQVVYGTGSIGHNPRDKELLAHVYTPQSACDGQKFPAILMLPGGGFTGGTRVQPPMRDLAEAYASRGYVVFLIDYRKVKNNPNLRAQSKLLRLAFSPFLDHDGLDEDRIIAGLAAFEDARTALTYIYQARNRYDIDTSRVAYLGASAGSIIGLNLFYVLDGYIYLPPVDVQVVVNLWGQMLTPRLMSRHDPALFTIHGNKDDVIPVWEAHRIHIRADEIGLRNQKHIVDRQHGFAAHTLMFQDQDGGSLVDQMIDFTEDALF